MKATIATTERMSNCATLSSWIKDKAMTPSLVDSRVRLLVVCPWDAFIVSWLNIIGYESRTSYLQVYTFHHNTPPHLKTSRAVSRFITVRTLTLAFVYTETWYMILISSPCYLLIPSFLLVFLPCHIFFDDCNTFLFLQCLYCQVWTANFPLNYRLVLIF